MMRPTDRPTVVFISGENYYLFGSFHSAIWSSERHPPPHPTLSNNILHFRRHSVRVQEGRIGARTGQLRPPAVPSGPAGSAQVDEGPRQQRKRRHHQSDDDHEEAAVTLTTVNNRIITICRAVYSFRRPTRGTTDRAASSQQRRPRNREKERPSGATTRAEQEAREREDAPTRGRQPDEKKGGGTKPRLTSSEASGEHTRQDKKARCLLAVWVCPSR